MSLTTISFAEIAAGIIAGCLPVLPRIFSHGMQPSPYDPAPKERSEEHIHRSWHKVFDTECQPSSTTRDNGFCETNSSLRRRSHSAGSSSKVPRSSAPYITSMNFSRSSWSLSVVDQPKLCEVNYGAQMPIHTSETVAEKQFRTEALAIKVAL